MVADLPFCKVCLDGYWFESVLEDVVTEDVFEDAMEVDIATVDVEASEE